MSKKQLYIAYGSNINLEQMAYPSPATAPATSSVAAALQSPSML